MKRALALLVCVALAVPGCAARSAPKAVGQGVRPASATGTSPQYIARDYARQLPIGAKVKVALMDGKSFSATFMGLEGEAVRVQKRTRIPEAPFLVPLEDLAELSLNQGGLGVGKAIAIGAGVGAGVFFTLLAILAASWD